MFHDESAKTIRKVKASQRKGRAVKSNSPHAETQLTHVRPGQSATIKVDIYPGQTFHGHVISISPGTGSSFAILPPENATGNWVKVVQRLPVRISIDDNDKNLPLRMGISATATVDTHSASTKEKVQHGPR